MTNMTSYWTGEADGGVIYLNGLTNEKDQRIRIIDWNMISMDHEKIRILEDRPEDPDEKKAREKEARKIARSIAKEFNSWAGKNSRVKNKFLSSVLSFSPKDREKIENDPQLQEDIIQEYLHQMGFDDAQFFAVYHYDTAAPHFHIYINMIGMDLKAYKSNMLRVRGQKACREVEKKFELSVGKGIDKDYKVDREKTNSRNKTRLEIRDWLNAAMKHYIWDFEKLAAVAKKSGITFEIKTMTNGKKGLVFHKDGDSFTGGEIDRSFTYGNLQRKLEINKALFFEITAVLDKFGVKPLGIKQAEEKFGMRLTKINMKDGTFGLFKIGKNYYISTVPYTNTSGDEKIWKGVNGQVFSFKDLVEVAKALKTGQVSVLARAKDIKPESTSKTTITPVSGTAPSFPVPTIPAAGHTVRDNKSAAHNGDGLDEFDEVVDENGNKVKVEKKKSLKL